MLLVSIYVMFLLLHVYDNGSAVLRVDKSIHARLSTQDSALVVYRKPRHHQLLARLLCYMDKQLFFITKDRTDLFIFIIVNGFDYLKRTKFFKIIRGSH